MKRLFFILGVTAFFSFSPLSACLQKGIEVGNPNLEGKVVTLESAGTGQQFRLEFGPPQEVSVTKMEGADLETIVTQYALVGLEVTVEVTFSDGTEAKFILLINEAGDILSATLEINGQNVSTTFTSDENSQSSPEAQTLFCAAAAPDVLNRIAGSLCSRIVSCTVGASCLSCETEVMNLPGLASSFGIHGNKNFQETVPDLQRGQIDIDGTALQGCLTAIETIPCSSVDIDPNNPVTYQKVKGMIPKPACARGVLKEKD